MEITNEQKRNLYRAGLALVIILCAFYAVRALSEFKSYRMMDNYGGSSITLAGHGEVSAVPDIANVSFTIHKEGKTVKIAQDAVAVVEKSALDFLKTNKIEDKDVKTTYASFNPKYEYKQALCPQTITESEAGGELKVVSMPYYCGTGKQVLVGYESYESITVKVRDTDNVGKIMQGLGGLGVTDLNGPNFAIDKEEDLKKEARKKAIDDAQEKAKILAADLGVKLGKIISFNEGGDYPIDMYYDKSSMMESAANSPAPAGIPKGENTISVDVVIIYEIK